MSIREIFNFKGRGLEEIIFLQVVGTALIAMVAITINAAIHGLFHLFIFDLGVLLILTTFFYLARFKGLYQYLSMPFIIILLLLIDISWFISMGYLGPNTYFMIGILIVGLIILKKNQRVLFTLIVFVNAIPLYIIEYLNPELSVRIPFHTDIIGQGVIFAVMLFLFSILIIQLKNNYERDRAGIIDLNRQVSGQKDEIEKKNTELEYYSANLKNEVERKTKQLESLNADLKEQNLSHEQFTYILAHNIRSPITQLKGLYGVLPIDIAKDELTKETLQRMENSISKLGDVINDLSKIVNSRKDNEDLFEQFSISKQLSLTLNTLEDQIKASKAEIDISKVEDIEINGIKAYIQSILYNLIHNAIKYSSKDRVPIIKIAAKQIAGKVQITVSDNGIGIDLEQAKGKVFQLYQRFNTDRPGKGFGLFLIKTQVKSMGGEIDLESEVGKGTLFNIILPQQK